LPARSPPSNLSIHIGVHIDPANFEEDLAVNRRSTLSHSCVLFLFVVSTFPALFAQHVVATVPVGSEPRGVAVNPNTGHIYVANVTGGSVSVLQTNTVIATIPVDTLPYEIAVDAKTNRVYAAGCNFFTGAGSMVVVIDGNTNQVITNISLNQSCGLGTQGIAANQFTNRVYVSDYDDSQEVVIDGATNQILTRVDLAGRAPLGVTVNLRTNQVWVVIDGPDGHMDVIDGHSNTLIDTVTVASVFLGDVAINPFTQRAYITSTSSPAGVYVLDTSTRQVITSVPFGSLDNAVDVDLLSNRVFVSDGQGNQVGVIDGSTNTLVATVPLRGSFPAGIAANPVTKRVYVSDFNSAQVEIMTEK
jgi:YVTN family beta-propeller protein